jgi:hypothetical protein
MAKRIGAFLKKVYFNPLEILLANQDKTLTLKGPQLGIAAHVLRYAETHGPAVYGTRENRFPVPALDELVASTLQKVESDSLELGSWDAIKNSAIGDVTVTLSGPQAQLLRSVLSYAEDKGNAFFGVPKTETDEDDYRSLVSDALNKL